MSAYTPALDKLLADAEKYRQDRLAGVQSDYESRVKLIQQNFELREKLQADGIEVPVEFYDSFTWLDVRLGERPRKGKQEKGEFARKLQAIRRIVGCPLKVEDKSVSDAKKRLVRYKVGCEAYPGLSIFYVASLPRKSKGKSEPKCKIKRVVNKHVSHQLVCSNEG